MPDTSGFEKAWLDKLSRALGRISGEEVRSLILDPDARGNGVAGLVEKVSSQLKRESAEEILTACACHYPHDQLEDVRERYLETGSVDEVIDMLREKFTGFLSETLGLPDTMVTEILARGWGLAGVRQGNTVIATKIPKSGNLARYLKETDPDRRRELYCHCPLVRDEVNRDGKVPELFCYCGAGFYQDLWETVLQAPVRVEVIGSIPRGDDVCSFRLHLPDDTVQNI